MQSIDEDDEDFNDDWMEDMKRRVDLCFSMVEEYIVESAEDPPSRAHSETYFRDIANDQRSFNSDFLPYSTH